ncbi:MAG: gliding motility-associated C-terminal domain-containing protein [Saprospiraceae bacterium]
MCTINQLDGYSYTMTFFPHASDGPQPMCPPPEGTSTSSQNPTWFAFIAWCENLSIQVTYSNCLDNPNFTGGACAGNNDFGIQAAVYSGCPATTANAVACDTDVNGCINNGARVLNLSGLNVGATYYFLVDGCCGAACEIDIDVVGACSQNGISNWFGGIDGPDVICKPDAIKTYMVTKLEGGLNYFWYIDGVPVVNGQYLTQPTLNFSALAPGMHTICVDANNPPCIYESDFPPPLCREVCVAPSPAEAGTIGTTPNPACPGQTVNINVTGYNANSGYIEHVFITNSSGDIVQVLSGTSGSIQSNTCEDFTVYSLNYFDLCLDFPVPAVGMNVSEFECDNCGCELISKVISFADNQPPVFVNPPASGTFACILQATPMGPLNYTDNCIPAGSVPGTESGATNACDGGVITREWEITDVCGNTANWTQTLDVNAVAIAAFINPPADITLNCADQLPTNLNLSYSNGGTAPCLISGSVAADVDENYTPCNGGTVTYTWTFTDVCDRTITHVRTITINPLVQAAFVNPPADITVDCSNLPASAPNLNYTNGMTGTCLISGNVPYTVQGNAPTVCGGDFFFNWTFTDQCGRTITHTQKITVTPLPEGNFVSPPNDIVVECNAIPTTGTPVTFTNGLSGPCQINANVIPTMGGSGDQCGGEIYFAYSYTDQCNRTKVDTQFVQINPIPEPYFVNPPANMTVTCENRPTTLPTLQVSNAPALCPITATVTATVSGSASECGGTLTYNWQYVDICSRVISHTQTVTVTPMPQGAFVNPPADMTVNCNQVPSGAPNLTIMNTGMGSCAINQSIVAVQSGSATQCGGMITYTWTHTDQCNRITTHDQDITVSPMLPPVFVNPPASMTVNCNQVPTSAPNLQAVNNDPNCPINVSVTPTQTGSATQCGGSITYTWTYTDPCGQTIVHNQTITVTPALAPVFINPPSDITVACDMIPTSGAILVAANNDVNCPINANVTPTQTGSATICGGIITYTWTYTDVCNRTITHTQKVTVTPMPPPTFVSLPQNVTVSCDQIPAAGATLNVVNNGPTGCNINTTATPVQTGSADMCGGIITYTWTFTDQCNRTITHTQTVTVTPMPQANFVNPPPMNITVNCDAIPAAGAVLTATNGSVTCPINATVTPVQTGSATICGGIITYTWTFTDQCNRTISYQQTVTVIPMLAPQFVSPPGNSTVTCDNIPTSAPNLNVINNGPVGCNINESVAAVLEGTPNACGGQFNYRWTYTDVCGRTIQHVQAITVSPTPLGAFQNPPENELVTCDLAPLPTSFPNLTFTNGLTGNCGINATVAPVVTGTANSCGGIIVATWTYTDFCNRTVTHTKTVTVQPAPLASFSNVPPDITVACGDLVNTPISINYSNNQNGACAISGSVQNVRNGTVSYCGGTLQDVWVYTDPCGRTISASRLITLLPAPPATFTSLPPNVTVSCEDVYNVNTVLNYTNGQSGVCAISGSVSPVESGSFNSCGGTVFYTWTFTDLCNRSITHTMTMTIEPAPDPDFVDPPQDQDLDCGGVNDPPSFILVSNGLTGPCGVNINAPLVSVTQNGGTYTNKWEYTHPCTGQVFTHIQKTFTIIAPNLFVQDPDIEICQGNVFDLSSIEVIDLNDTDPVITYHSTIPADPSNEILPEIMPNPGDVYFIRGLNAEGCDDIVIIYFNVFDAPNAGGDGNAKVCNDGSTLNLNGLLNNGAQTGGSWVQVGGSNINLSNPAAVNFNGVAPGSYNLSYIVESQYDCPPDTSFFVIAVTQKINLNLALVDCVPGGTWEIKLTTNAPGITTTLGTVQKLTLDTFRVYNIPQGQGVTINASSANNVCQASLVLTAPNCACPFIPAPTGNTSYTTCESAVASIVMTVTVPAGMQANWFAVPVGGTALVSNSLTYNHTNGSPGVYTYYVETYDPATGCYSLSRLEVQVEIFSKPQVNNHTLTLCDAGNNGTESFDFNEAHGEITSLANSISFHLTLADAQSGSNPLVSPYNNVSSPQKLYVSVVNQAGCKNIAELDLMLNPVPAPVLTVVDESCVGSDNGSVTAVNANPNETVRYTLDNQNWSNTGVFTNLPVSNYILISENQFLCRSQQPFSIQTGLLIQIQTFSAVCDNKGTLSDPADDVYHITLLVGNNLNVAGSFQLVGTNGFTGQYNYNTTYNFDLPANGATITFTLTDVVRACTANRTIGPLNSCSTNCVADLEIISLNCNGNGTPSDPNDDFYELSFRATALNGAATNMYILSVDNVPKGNYMYGITYNINIAATNQLATVRVTDAEDVQCSTSKDIGPLNNCSNQCILNALVESVNCVNPGGSPSPLDDYYEVKIKASIINGGTSTGFSVRTSAGATVNGTYNTTLTLTIPAAGQNEVLTITDSGNSACNTTLNLNVLEPCSGPCEVNIDIVDYDCSDNGTTNNSADDVYTISIMTTLVNGGNSGTYKLTVDGKDYQGKYGEVLKIMLPADSKAHNISVVDNVSAECKGNAQTDLLLPCSVPCTINATVLSFDCNNGGTTSDTGDDTYTVTISATASNGGTGFTAVVDGKSTDGLYGQNLILNFKADNVVHTITITDKNNTVCTAVISTPLLAPCSGPCEITAVASNIVCNNNGTNNTDADDVFTFDLLVTGNNTQWKTDQFGGVEGFVGNKKTMGPFPIAGSVSTFLVYYANSPNCKQNVNITLPPTCSACTQTADAGNGGELSCTQNAILLTGTASPNGVNQWYLNGNLVTTATTLIAGEPGWYHFVATYPDGCVAEDSVLVTIDDDLPVVTVTRGMDLTCEINEVTLTATATGNNLKYEWTTEEGVVVSEGLTLKVTEEGKYFFRAYNTITGCSSAKILVEVLKDTKEPSSVIYARPTYVFDCVIKTITLYNVSEPDVSYTWRANGSLLSTNETVDINTTGNYSLIAIDTISGCWSESSLVINSLIEYPIINLVVEDTLDCVTSSVFLSSEGSQVGPDISYQWQDKNRKNISTTPGKIEVTEPGNYYLILKDSSNGCTNEDTASVEVFENEIDINLPVTIFVQEGDTVRLNTILNIPASEIQSIKWTPTDNLSCTDCLNPVVTVPEDASYTIEVIDIYGCKAVATVRLLVTKQEIVNIPNIIEIDNGTNGGFTLYGNDQVERINYLKIYDRWGNLMFINENFVPNQPSLGWDGRFNGKPVVPGVFVYVFEVEINGIGPRVYAGDVTVIK